MPWQGLTVVGVMGGHNAQRGTPEFAQAALLGRLLAGSGRLVATGGGPGAMEAANLGAYLSGVPEQEFEAALASLGAVPGLPPLGVRVGTRGRRRRRTFSGRNAVAGNPHLVLRA